MKVQNALIEFEYNFIDRKGLIDEQSSLVQHCSVFDIRLYPQKLYGKYLCYVCVIRVSPQWPLLLTWFNFNPSMDK